MRLDPTQAEYTVCCTVIDKPHLLDDSNLTHDDFLDPDLGLVYRTVTYLYDADKPVNNFSVMEKLAKRLSVEKLTRACDITQSQPWAVRDAMRIVRDAAMRRRVIATGQKMLDIANNAERMDEEAIAEVEKAFDEVSTVVESERHPVHIADLLPGYWEKFEQRTKNKGKLRGAMTGFAILNGWLGGWVPTYLSIIGARPGMGKTAFMLQSSTESAVQNVAVVFSIEMFHEILIDRMMASNASVELGDVMDAEVTPEQISSLIQTMTDLEGKTLYIDDNANVTVPYIRSRLRRIARKHPGKQMVVYVDYLQLVKVNQRGRSRDEEIAEISTGLKGIAKELQCSVVALAQLNRNVESRQDKRPTISDLRGSGQIEQDADVIMFLYRESYYDPNADPDETSSAEVIVAKNRNGPRGTAHLAFMPGFQKFIEADVPKPDGR